MKTPVAFFIFNRPDNARQVFEVIRQARPEKLFVIADGGHPKCAEARAIIRVDWPCEVVRNYSDINLGCKMRLSSGLDWVFEQAERAIILEDDCVPDISFFPFCEELLEKYADDESVMHIGGSSFYPYAGPASYYFARVPLVWGWASWRRAWKKYDVNISTWPKMKQTGALKKRVGDRAAYRRFSSVWNQYYAGTVNSWDGQWTYICFLHDGLSISPAVNLVTNIGFVGQSKAQNPFVGLPRGTMDFPLRAPAAVATDKAADIFTYKNVFNTGAYSWPYRIARKIRNFLSRRA